MITKYCTIRLEPILAGFTITSVSANSQVLFKKNKLHIRHDTWELQGYTERFLYQTGC